MKSLIIHLCGWRSFWVAVALLVSSSCDLRAQTNLSNASPEQLKKLSLEDLMKLDVTSVSKGPQPYGEAPASIQVITGDDIRRSGANSIAEALRLADNLEVAQINAYTWAISARGFNTRLANKLLVLIDGRSVYTPLDAGVFWEVQDYLLADIDRIEVISGPGGTLWGENAVNGVINIVTKSAQETQGVYVESGGGTSVHDFAGVRYGTALSSNVFIRMYAKYFDDDGTVFSNGNPAGDEWQFGQTGFRIDSTASTQNPMTLQGDFYSGEENARNAGDVRTGGANLLGRWNHVFSDDADTQLQLYYDRTHRLVPVKGGTLEEDLGTFDLDFQDHFRLGEWNRFTWGLGYRFTHDAVENSPGVNFIPSVLDQNLFSSFAQDEITLHEGVVLTAGTKLEHNDYTGFELEPSGRLGWTVATNQLLWGAVSRAVRAPSRIDRDLSITGELMPGSNFVSETLVAYELGYRGQLGPRIAPSISLFYNDYDHIRSIGPTGISGTPLVFQNDLEGQTYGFEAASSWQVIDLWRLHAGYDLLEEHLFVRAGTVDIDNGLQETTDPQQQVFLRSSMDLPYRLEFDTGGRWIDTLHNNSGTSSGSVPSYFEMDARIAWEATPHLEFSITGENLLHDHHPEFGFPGATRNEIPRSVFGKVSWRF